MSDKSRETIANTTPTIEYKYPTTLFPKIAPEQDRMVRPKEAVIITGRSLASQHRDKKAGKWPPMYRIGNNAVGNRLSDLLALNASREVVTAENTTPVAPGAKRGRKPKNQLCSVTEKSLAR